jgi:hypothetical protein
LDGFTKKENQVAPTKIKQRVLQELVLKKMLQENAERKNENQTLLEFLESCLCGMVDTISKECISNNWNTPWDIDSDHI